MKRTSWTIAAALLTGFGLTLTLAGCNNDDAGKAPEGPAPAASGAGVTADSDKPAPESDGATGSSPGKAASFPTGYPKGGPGAEGEKKKEGDAGKAPEGEKKEGDAKPAEGEKKEGEPKTAAVKLTDAEIAQIKKLPEADQKIALAQMICPVGEGHLGDPDMGAPVKVQLASGQTVFTCCKGCVDELKANPEKYLAKLKK